MDRPVLAILLSLVTGCSSSHPAPGVIQHQPEMRMTSVPGPIQGMGPFDSFSDALIAACPLIMRMPHATAGQRIDPNSMMRWRLSTEYCAWLYYTPDDKYEISMLVTNPVQDDPRMRQCDLPAWVDDRRYSPEALGYVFMLHNHAYGAELSDHDYRGIVRMAQIHGSWIVKTKVREVPIGIIAFFSSSDTDPVNCDGFYQYLPITGEVMQWTLSRNGRWDDKQIASVTWTGPDQYRIERK